MCHAAAKICIMARFKYSGVAITGGTGRLNSSMGGSVLLKNGVVRNYVTPINPKSEAQIEVRNVFTSFNTGWKANNSEAQKEAWETAAKSGDWPIQDPFTGTSRNPTSGKELYTTLNMNIWLAGGKVVNETNNVPVKQAAGTSQLGDSTATAAVQSLSIVYSGDLAGNEVHVLSTSKPLSSGRLKFRRNEMRYIMATGNATPIDALAAFQAVHGNLTGQAGNVIFVLLEAVNIVTGQRRVAGTSRIVIGA